MAVRYLTLENLLARSILFKLAGSALLYMYIYTKHHTVNRQRTSPVSNTPVYIESIDTYIEVENFIQSS